VSEGEGDCCQVIDYFGDYVTVAAFAAVGILIVGGGIAVSSLLRPNNPNVIKSETYECGIDPVGGGWSQTHIRYYIFALLFLIFDVEAVFIFPWAVNIELFQEAGRGLFIFGEMMIFIGILVLGLVYAIRKGVLRWE
jgi:NADH-quinone oxidoreductase subunit A